MEYCASCPPIPKRPFLLFLILCVLLSQSVIATPGIWSGYVLHSGSYFSDFFTETHPSLRSNETPVSPVKRGMDDGRPLDVVLDEFDQYLDGIARRNLTPGMAVAVVHGNDTVYTRCLGVKRIGYPDPIDEDTVFQIGSNSKPITGAVIARLVDRGVVDWDDRVALYYPGFALHDTYAGEHLTFRDALSHRSGLPSHAGGELMVPFCYEAPEILHRIRYLEPATEFRTAYEYQNVMYLLAGEAAAKAAGKDWPDLAADEVFIPLGMNSTSARFVDFISAENRAWNYWDNNGTFEEIDPLNYDAMSPAGGVSSTLRDMARWVLFQVGDGGIEGELLLSPGVFAETHALQTVISSSDTYVSGYTLGWFYSFLEDGLILDHGGSATSSTSYVMIMPKEKIGIVVLCNKGISHSLPMAVCYTFREMYLHGTPRVDLYEAFRTTIDPSFHEIQPLDALPDPHEDALPPLPLRQYEGAYHSDYYGRIWVEQSGEGLNLYTGANPVPFNLSPWEGNTFREESSYTAVNFTVEADGNASAVLIGMLHFNMRNGTFVRVQ